MINPINKTVSKTRKQIVIHLDRPTGFFTELFFTVTETLLERNETRGDNLPLGGSACVVFVICRTRNLCLLICGIQRNTESFWNSKDLKDKRLRIFRYVGDIS